MAGNEIMVGMKFGSFYASTEALGKKYRSEDNYTGQRSSIDYKDDAGKIVATSSKSVNQENKVEFTIYDNNAQRVYTSSVKPDRNRNLVGDIKFDRIESQNFYAVDKNSNGIVDEGEIFEKNNPQNAWLF